MSNINFKDSLDLLDLSFDKKINKLNQNKNSKIMIEQRKNADVLATEIISLMLDILNNTDNNSFEYNISDTDVKKYPLLYGMAIFDGTSTFQIESDGITMFLRCYLGVKPKEIMNEESAGYLRIYNTDWNYLKDNLSSYGITIQHNLNNIHVNGNYYLEELVVHYSRNKSLKMI